MSMVRKIDELGRIVLPMEFRKALKIDAGCDVRMELKDGNIVLSPNECICTGCGATISPDADYMLCDACIARIKSGEPSKDGADA